MIEKVCRLVCYSYSGSFFMLTHSRVFLLICPRRRFSSLTSVAWHRGDDDVQQVQSFLAMINPQHSQTVSAGVYLRESLIRTGLALWINECFLGVRPSQLKLSTYLSRRSFTNVTFRLTGSNLLPYRVHYVNNPSGRQTSAFTNCRALQKCLHGATRYNPTYGSITAAMKMA